MRVLGGVLAFVAAIAAFTFIQFSVASAAPYAAIVIDARDGSVLHSRSADRRLHPASLTKMMTLYMTFEAIRDGRLSLDQKVRISSHAARQVPSKIGLRRGSRVSIRHLIRATSVKSANDAAVALAEAQAKSEADFARMMTERARRMGMTNTTFRNASGLTHNGQLSTARDMALLGRALIYDFPQYYNLFSRQKTYALGRTIYNTNRRLLRSYRGADGIKTGYTNAAGFNLVSSAERGGKRVIAVVFGGKSSRSRDRRVAELLDLGFRRAPAQASVTRVAQAAAPAASPSPLPRPGAAEAPSLLAMAGEEIGEALVPAAAAATTAKPVFRPEPAEEARAFEIAVAVPLPRPSRTGVTAPAPVPRPDAARPEESWAVQLGVFAREDAALAAIESSALGGTEGASPRIARTILSGRTAWRAQLTGLDRTAALSMCSSRKSAGKDCLAIAPAGR